MTNVIVGVLFPKLKQIYLLIKSLELKPTLRQVSSTLLLFMLCCFQEILQDYERNNRKLIKINITQL